ncbi:Hypothetical predicted protein [Octopus vulgaris]|uniref:Uncharacterized protein n=1 Tax=Octopus vulgaris TaxID=6645 RepID=A0AA36F6S0_OCTVU|nr:Hypothetical predicted protein [Octopus vulgaris]
MSAIFPAPTCETPLKMLPWPLMIINLVELFSFCVVVVKLSKIPQRSDLLRQNRNIEGLCSFLFCKLLGNPSSTGGTKIKKEKHPAHTIKWLALGRASGHRNQSKADMEYFLRELWRDGDICNNSNVNSKEFDTKKLVTTTNSKKKRELSWFLSVTIDSFKKLPFLYLFP